MIGGIRKFLNRFGDLSNLAVRMLYGVFDWPMSNKLELLGRLFADRLLGQPESEATQIQKLLFSISNLLRECSTRSNSMKIDDQMMTCKINPSWACGVG